MGRILKAIVLVSLAFVLSGFVHEQFVADKTQTETRVFTEIVRPGDTFNNIIEQYYDGSINVCWDEWQTQQKERNSKLFKNGRFLQPGDKIIIETKVKVDRTKK